MFQSLNEEFNAPHADSRLRWLNEPSQWRIDPGRSVLVVEPDANTDFWRRTHYGFEADSGHLLHAPVHGDFLVMANVSFFPVHQYDQAGLMVRADGDCWIKTSVEYELDKAPKLGAVVTNGGYSDWSVQNFDRARNHVWLRIARRASDFVVEHSEDGQSWHMLRITHLSVGPDTLLQCGLYACSPKAAGFRAEFDLLHIAEL